MNRPTFSNAFCMFDRLLTLWNRLAVHSGADKSGRPQGATRLRLESLENRAVPAVWLGSTGLTLAEGSSGTLTVFRSADDTSEPLTVNLSISQSGDPLAAWSDDYVLTSPSGTFGAGGGTVTFGVDETDVSIDVSTQPDAAAEGIEGFRIAVLDGNSGGGSGGSGGGPTTADVQIDDPTPAVDGIITFSYQGGIQTIHIQMQDGTATIQIPAESGQTGPFGPSGGSGGIGGGSIGSFTFPVLSGVATVSFNDSAGVISYQIPVDAGQGSVFYDNVVGNATVQIPNSTAAMTLQASSNGGLSANAQIPTLQSVSSLVYNHNQRTTTFNTQFGAGTATVQATSGGFTADAQIPVSQGAWGVVYRNDARAVTYQGCNRPDPANSRVIPVLAW